MSDVSTPALVEDDLETRIALRAAQRAARTQERIAAAEACKERGNEHFRRGDFVKAVICYKEAGQTYPANAVYACNASACFLKLEMYDLAETGAIEALKYDPRSVKARYRRGLARMKLKKYWEAMADFVAALRLDPSCEGAREQLYLVRDVLKMHADAEDDSGDDTDPEYAYPPLDKAPAQDWETGSDSEDFRHEGCFLPCKDYNHGGCEKGRRCSYAHGPDQKSIRDKIGRNVCAHYIFDGCKASEGQCDYSHDLRALPEEWITLREDGVSLRKFKAVYVVLDACPPPPGVGRKQTRALTEICRNMVEDMSDDLEDLQEVLGHGVYSV